MADKIIIAIQSLARGMKTFVRPWNRPYVAPQRKPRNVSVYFDAVGKYISRAECRFAEGCLATGGKNSPMK